MGDQKANKGSTACSQPGPSELSSFPKPLLPDFNLPGSPNNKEKTKFWKQYPKRVQVYNSDVIYYWYQKFKNDYANAMKRTTDDGHPLPKRRRRGFSTEFEEHNEDLERKRVRFLQTNFETQKLLLVRREFKTAEWYLPPCFDLSEHVGHIVYCTRVGSDDLVVKDDGSFSSGGMDFKITFFNFIEKRRIHKGALVSGYRISLSGLDFLNVSGSTMSVVITRIPGKTRVVFEYARLRSPESLKSLVFLVPGTILPDTISQYSLKNSKGGIDICIDMEIPLGKVLRKVRRKRNDGTLGVLTNAVITTSEIVYC